MKIYTYLGTKIIEESYSWESRGYDNNSTIVSHSSRYSIGKKLYGSLNEAKMAIFLKTSKGKNITKQIRRLSKEENKLENRARALNKKIEKLRGILCVLAR